MTTRSPFPPGPELIGDVWKGEWYCAHCYKIPAIAALNTMLSQVGQSPTASAIADVDASLASLKQYHEQLGDLAASAESAQKQVAFFLQCVQQTALSLQKQAGKRVANAEKTASKFKKWFWKAKHGVEGRGASGGGGLDPESNQNASNEDDGQSLPKHKRSLSFNLSLPMRWSPVDEKESVVRKTCGGSNSLKILDPIEIYRAKTESHSFQAAGKKDFSLSPVEFEKIMENLDEDDERPRSVRPKRPSSKGKLVRMEQGEGLSPMRFGSGAHAVGSSSSGIPITPANTILSNTTPAITTPAPAAALSSSIVSLSQKGMVYREESRQPSPSGSNSPETNRKVLVGTFFGKKNSPSRQQVMRSGPGLSGSPVRRLSATFVADGAPTSQTATGSSGSASHLVSENAEASSVGERRNRGASSAEGGSKTACNNDSDKIGLNAEGGCEGAAGFAVAGRVGQVLIGQEEEDSAGESRKGAPEEADVEGVGRMSEERRVRGAQNWVGIQRETAAQGSGSKSRKSEVVEPHQGLPGKREADVVPGIDTQLLPFEAENVCLHSQDPRERALGSSFPCQAGGTIGKNEISEETHSRPSSTAGNEEALLRTPGIEEAVSGPSSTAGNEQSRHHTNRTGSERGAGVHQRRTEERGWRNLSHTTAGEDTLSFSIDEDSPTLTSSNGSGSSYLLRASSARYQPSSPMYSVSLQPSPASSKREVGTPMSSASMGMLTPAPSKMSRGLSGGAGAMGGKGMEGQSLGQFMGRPHMDASTSPAGLRTPSFTDSPFGVPTAKKLTKSQTMLSVRRGGGGAPPVHRHSPQLHGRPRKGGHERLFEIMSSVHYTWASQTLQGGSQQPSAASSPLSSEGGGSMRNPGGSWSDEYRNHQGPPGPGGALRGSASTEKKVQSGKPPHSPAKKAQEEMLLELLRAAPPIKWTHAKKDGTDTHK